MTNNLSYITRLAEKTDVPVYLGFIPSAAEVWRDKLPAGAESWDQTAFLDRAAEETGLPTVDFAGALTAHADEPIFYRTDHHWTSLGGVLRRQRGTLCSGPSHAGPGGLLRRRWSATTSMAPLLHLRYPLADAGRDGVLGGGGRHLRHLLAHRQSRTGGAVREELSGKEGQVLLLPGREPAAVRAEKTSTTPTAGRFCWCGTPYSDSLAPFPGPVLSEVHLLDLRYYRAPVSQYAAENDIDEIVVPLQRPQLHHRPEPGAADPVTRKKKTKSAPAIWPGHLKIEKVAKPLSRIDAARCAQDLPIFNGQIPHLRAEKCFLRRTCRRRKPMKHVSRLRARTLRGFLDKLCAPAIGRALFGAQSVVVS